MNWGTNSLILQTSSFYNLLDNPSIFAKLRLTPAIQFSFVSIHVYLWLKNKNKRGKA